MTKSLKSLTYHHFTIIPVAMGSNPSHYNRLDILMICPDITSAVERASNTKLSPIKTEHSFITSITSYMPVVHIACGERR